MQKVVRNIIFSVIGFAWPLILTLVTLPYIVHGLGNSMYGVFVLTLNLLGYMGIFNSLQAASTKYLSEYIALNNFDGVNKILSTTLVFNLSIGIVGGMIIFIFAEPLATVVFQIPKILQSDAIGVFRLTSIGFVISTLGWWGSGILNGLQRIDLYNTISIIMLSISSIGGFIVVMAGMGIYGIVLINIFGSLFAVVLYLYFIFRLLPAANLRFKIDPKEFKIVFSFGIFSTIQVILGIVSMQLDRTILGIWFGVEAVTIYGIPLSVAQRIHGLCSKALETIFPISSGLSANSKQDKLQKLFIRSQNLDHVLIIGFSVPLFILAGEILKYWISDDLANNGTVVFRLLIITNALLAMTAPMSFVVAGLGHPEINTAFAFLLGISNLIGYFLFIPHEGVIGAGKASLLGSVVSVPVYLWYINWKYVKISWKEFFLSTMIKPIFAGMAFAFFIFISRSFFVNGLITLIITIGFTGLVYSASTFIFKVWDEEEQSILIGFFNRLIMRISNQPQK